MPSIMDFSACITPSICDLVQLLLFAQLSLMLLTNSPVLRNHASRSIAYWSDVIPLTVVLSPPPASVLNIAWAFVKIASNEPERSRFLLRIEMRPVSGVTSPSTVMARFSETHTIRS